MLEYMGVTLMPREPNHVSRTYVKCQAVNNLFTPVLVLRHCVDGATLIFSQLVAGKTFFAV